MESASNKNHVYPSNYDLTQYSCGVTIEEWEFETKDFVLHITKTDHLNDSKSNRFIAEFDDFKIVTKSFCSLLNCIDGIKEEIFYCAMSSGGDIKEEVADSKGITILNEKDAVHEAKLILLDTE